MSKLLRVLIVEDNDDDALLLVRHLTKGGYEVQYKQVQTGDEMRRSLEELEWDIVLADYSMPDFSGPQALAVFNDCRIDIPFIVISGTIGEENAASMMRCGASDYIMKDNITRLLPAVERELEEAKHRKEKRNAQQEIRNQRDFLQTVLDSLAHPFYVIDVNTYKVRIANKKAREINDLADKSFCYESFHNQNKCCDSPEIPCPIEIIKKTKEPAIVFHRHPDKAARERHYEVRGYPVFDKNGKLSKVIEYSLDITDKIKAEEHLQQLQEELENAQRLAIKGQVASELAHEISNPMTFISVRIQQLIKAGSENPKKLEEIMEQIDRVKGLLKEFSNIGKQEKVFFQDEQIGPVVDNAVNLVSATKKIDKMQIKKDIKAGLPSVKINKNKIIQILLNLLINAIDACEGEVDIIVSADRKILSKEERQNQAGEYIEISVRDNGCGMTDGQIRKIFEPFYSTKSGDKGMGLGLPISLSIAEQHKGWIDVESKPGEGSIFKLFLPVKN